ncbi:DUF397 domain-containing protein [Streptosporangium sp. NBC_01755]|uniref:DUF397 domain-containing protein n=1 Tax=unclassified Streptosporangium TaxID=2632669 RepID=UPI002DD8F06C|nr:MULTISPECIES: DUF397 domain-containing protein [unclassified Streptosporangium]WSA29472.1 DUF397 domain-containing protein [Streptosporangium sp. NBC_01810]WSC99108.1 DUF397 domain-containing protein [Streptosporangium sp. NBC_01755]
MVGDRYSCGIWRKSTRSGAQSNCVEARFDGTTVWLHNSNNPSPQGPTIAITPKTWLTLLDQVQAGNLTPQKLNSPTLLAGLLLIGFDGEHITVRDNDTPTVHYTLDEWHAFLDGVTHDGEFTLPWLLGIPANA